MDNKNSESRLVALAELLFMPMAFYVLIQWDKMDTWQGKVLWLMIFALVQNEFLSIRNSYRMYTASLYLLDLGSLAVYVMCLDALTQNNSIMGYDPKFWIYLSILWAGYALWDFRMISINEEPQMKAKYKEWGRIMILFFGMTLLCGIVLITIAKDNVKPIPMYIIYILQFIPFSFIIWSLSWWIRDLSTALKGSKQS